MHHKLDQTLQGIWRSQSIRWVANQRSCILLPLEAPGARFQQHRPRIPGRWDTAHHPVLPPPGQVEGGVHRTGNSPAAGRPGVVQVSDPHHRSIQASVDWETRVVTRGELTPGPDLAAASVVVPPGVTLCLGGAGLPGDRGLIG